MNTFVIFHVFLRKKTFFQITKRSKTLNTTKDLAYLKIIIKILSGGFSSESGGIIEKGKKILQLTSS